MTTDTYTPMLVSARVWALTHGCAPDDADDVAQDAVIRLWRRERAGVAWPAPAARYGYLHRCVRSVLIDRSRAAGAGVALLPLRAATGQSGSTEQAALARIALRETRVALARLGRNGQAVTLRAAGYTPREIAARLGLRPRTAYAAIAAGRVALREDQYA